MENLSQRLIEVEYVLNRMNEQNIKKVPKKFWDFINENKDINYNFKYDDSKSILENSLHLDSIAILTYININFLLDSKSKKEMIKLLKEDELIAEEEKRKRYNPDTIFKDKEKNIEQPINSMKMIEYKESILKKIILKIKKFLDKHNS